MIAGELKELPVGVIERNPGQPRETFERIDELAESIRENGLLQPITVRETAPGKFEIVAGERRWRAVTSLGWEAIPAMVVVADDRTAYELSVLENMARADMNPLEEAKALQKLLDLGIDAAEVERNVGFGDNGGSHVRWKVAVLACIDEAQHLLARGHLSPSRAHRLARLSRNGQLRVLRAWGSRPMSNSEFTGLCDQLLAEESQVEMFAETKLSKEVQEAADKFQQTLATLSAAAVKLRGIPPEQVAAALAHKADVTAATIEEITRILAQVRTAIQKRGGRQIALQD